MFDFVEVFRRLFKYLIQGFILAVAAYVIPKQSLKMEEILLLALTAGATFCLLDSWMPGVAVAARSGAGFGIGATMVGFPGGL